MNIDKTQSKLIYPDLSSMLLKISFEVHNQIGSGFTEDIYERAFAFELGFQGIPFEEQKVISVSYKGKPVGIYRLDLVIDNKIILELKAVSQINDLFKHQLYSYLRASGLTVGYIINFGGQRVERIRVVLTRSSA